ncbi:MAG: serine/threonine protein kinase, partial [Lachnospiraceae bacterium]|nr:serine/threonine protein kinase [Lachnospiraceae bacterium]
VRKLLSVYDLRVYDFLIRTPLYGLPRIYEAKETEDGLSVIEEYIAGKSLSEILAEKGRMSQGEALHIFRQLLRILRGLHEQMPPIIHRDIKPSNILLSSDGFIKLIDLNAAKFASSAGSRDTVLIGTEGYAAPEQYGFSPSSTRTDIYALGVLLNVMLTGRLPSEETVTGPLRPVIIRCTAISSQDRYGSVQELEKAIDMVDTGTAPGGSAVSLIQKKQRPWTRFLPPGMRGLVPWKILLSGIGYICFFLMGFNMKVKEGSIWLNRIFFMLSGICIILISGNYLGILDKLGITKIKNRWGRLVLIILLDFLAFIGLIWLMSAFE